MDFTADAVNWKMPDSFQSGGAPAAEPAYARQVNMLSGGPGGCILAPDIGMTIALVEVHKKQGETLE